MFPTTAAVNLLLSDGDPWVALVKLIGLIVSYIIMRVVQDARLRALADEAVHATEELALSGELKAKGQAKTQEAVAYLKKRAWFTPTATALRLVAQAVFNARGIGASSKRYTTILLLVLGLGLLASPAQAIDRVQLDDTVAAATTVTVASRSEAAVPVTATVEPSPLLDFGSLLPAAHGQQREEGMQGFDVVGVVPLYLLKNKRTGKLGYADPIELSAGRLAVHAYLIAYAALGWPTSRWHAQERAIGIVETKARQALARAGAVAVTQIPQLVGQADTLVAGVLRGLSGR